MNNNNTPENSSQSPIVNWRSLLWTFALLLLLNSFVFPFLFKPKIIPTTYSNFINKVDSSLVKKVNIDGNKIFFTTPNGTVDR